MSTEINSGVSDTFAGTNSDNRNNFFSATEPAVAHSAMQYQVSGTMSYTSGTELPMEVGAIFKMDGNDITQVADAPATDTGRTFNSDLNMSPNLA